MNEKQLKNIINLGENETVEIKSSFNKTVIETIVAFSNHKGGKIFVGIDDKGKIKGVTLATETIQKWINEVKQNTEPSIIPDVEIINSENKTIVIFSINEYPVKPVSF